MSAQTKYEAYWDDLMDKYLQDFHETCETCGKNMDFEADDTCEDCRKKQEAGEND